MAGDRRRAGRWGVLPGILLGIWAVPAFAVSLDVYVAAWCGYCRALENDLRTRRIPFFAHDIEADARARREYDALGGKGLPLTRVGKQVVRGYDLPAILKLLDRAE